MGLLGMFVGGQAKGTVEAVGDAFDKIFTNDEERAEAQAVLNKIAMKPHLLQAEINKIEAQHRSVFVAGGRPALLWAASVGWFVEFIVNPVFFMFSGKEIPMPVEQMVWLTGAVLGVYGTQRTIEKLSGKSK